MTPWLHPLTQLLLPAAHTRAHAPIAVAPLLTRTQCIRDCLQLAGALHASNIRHAALWFEDAALLAISLFACWRAGVTATLAGDAQAHTCTALAGQTDIWLSDQTLAHVPADRQWHIAQPLVQGLGSAPLPAAELDPNVQVVMCTSGSSGTPKHIRKHWWQLLCEVRALQQQWPLDPAQTLCVLGSVSVQHMYGLPFRLLWPLAAGVPIDRWQRPYPEALQHASSAHERFVWIASPAMLCRLGNSLDWAQLRGRLLRIYSAGGVLPAAVSDTFARNLGARPIEIYGSSETGVIAWRTGADDWQPFSGVAVRCNEAGALHVRSPWLQEAGEQTADGAMLTERGFQLQGRLDRIVKIEGKRIALPMLEGALAQHPFVAQAHVGAVAHRTMQTQTPTQTQRIAALVALSSEGVQALRQQGRTALTETLRSTLMGRVEPLAVPRIWRFFAHLPVNAQGKVTRSLFEQAVQTRPVMPQARSLPPTATDATDAPAHSRHYALNIPCDLVHFSGHFPSAPVVPGVAQIGWALSLAQQDLLQEACPDFRFGGIEVLKFQRLLRPNDDAQLTLSWDALKRKLHFSLTVDGAPCSSGRILAA